MASTRRSASPDVGRNVPTSNPSPSSPPTIEQALMTQTQLLQTTAQSVLNNPQEAPPIDKHGTFSHASDPLEADDWLRAMERQLDIAHCDDQEKVLFASGQLQGAAQDW